MPVRRRVHQERRIALQHPGDALDDRGPVIPDLGVASGKLTAIGEGGFHRQACSRPAGLHVGPGEEGKVGSGVSHAVGVKEVIGTWIILVNASLYQAHAQPRNVEIQIFLGIAGNTSHVMNAVN